MMMHGITNFKVLPYTSLTDWNLVTDVECLLCGMPCVII